LDVKKYLLQDHILSTLGAAEGRFAYSIPNGAQYGNLHNKLDEEKSTYAGMAQETGFTPAFFPSFLRLVKKCSKPVHLLEKSAINVI
jgi:hypothetical protein